MSLAPADKFVATTTSDTNVIAFDAGTGNNLWQQILAAWIRPYEALANSGAYFPFAM